MISESSPRAALRARNRASAIPRSLAWQHIALAAVAALAVVLDFYRLSTEGYANTYYAAAVKSMMMNLHNFFFVSFDPGGFVAVDKSPLGLWVQVASAEIFGFNGFSLLLPQALAGVLSVLVLYRLVSRVFGPAAGLFAGLALALTPIAVVDNRNNSFDSLLILTLLLAAWVVMRATETGRLRWLLAGAALVGLGFNIKEMEAFLALPALGVLYLGGAPRDLVTRIRHLLLAGFTTLVVSFAWIVAVDLTPASGRPYVSDSGTNSELSLALGYNGLGRLLSGIVGHMPTVPILNVKLDLSIVPGASIEIGNPGILRLLEGANGAQASWLLIPAMLAVVAALLVWKPRLARPSREHLAVLFWGTWLLTAGAFFSVARFYHLYYLIILAPAVAALAGIGAYALWLEYRETLESASPRLWRGWLLPLAVVVTGLAQTHIMSSYSTWNSWLGPAILVVCAIIAAALILGRLGVRFALEEGMIVQLDRRMMLAAATLAGVALLAAPGAFAADAVANGNGAAWLPQAGPIVGFGFGGGGLGVGGARPGGPRSGFRFGPRGTGSAPPGAPPVGRTTGARRFVGPGSGGGFAGGGGALTFAGGDTPTLSSTLLRYLESHQGHARYLVATPTSSYASLFILATGRAVMTLGGYQGWDRILSLAALKRDVKAGTVRFFLISGGGGFGGPGAGGFGPGGRSAFSSTDTRLARINNDLTSWVTSSCKVVPASTYGSVTRQSSSGGLSGPGRGFVGQSGGTLYDCAATAAARG